MTFVAASFLSISIDLLLLIFVVVCLLMTLVILMQRPKQEGLGAAFGGGVTDQVFGARTTNVLQRGTVYLGTMFFIISLLLSLLIGQQNKTTNTVTSEDLTPQVEKDAAPATPAVEIVPESMKDELPQDETTPDTTPAPAEVPADASEAVPVVPAVEAVPAETVTSEEVPAAPDATPADASVPADKTPADAPKEP